MDTKLDIDFQQKANANFLNNAKAYAGNNQNMIDYERLWNIRNEDVDSKENQVRFDVEKEYETKAMPLMVPPPIIIPGVNSNNSSMPSESVANALAAGLPQMTSGSGAQTSSAYIKQRIVSNYLTANFTRERIIEHLMPNATEMSVAKIAKVVKEDIKELDERAVETFLMTGANDKKNISKAMLRDLLFENAGDKRDLHAMPFEDQIDQVFTDLDMENKNAISATQVGQGLKNIGINKSSAEVGQLFNDFKKPTSMFLDRNDFSRLVKYEFSKDIVKAGLLRPKLRDIVEKANPFKTSFLTEQQLKFVYKQAGSAQPSQEEIQALMSYCKSSEQAGVDSEKFVETVVSGPSKFAPEQDKLAAAILRLRSELCFNVAEQYNSFKYMPSNFTASFTEEAYISQPSHLPTATLRPTLGDSKGYYSNLYPPLAGQESNAVTRFTKYLKLTKHCAVIEVKLNRASGVPIPDDAIVNLSAMAGREVRIGIFEENRNMFVGNILNLECRWSESYEDRWYFDTAKLDNENILIVKIPEAELLSKDRRYDLVLEFVNFVRKPGTSKSVAMSAGFARMPLAEIADEKKHDLPIIGGSPYREKVMQIMPEDVRHKRKGFFPKIVGIFEGQVKSRVSISAKTCAHKCGIP